MADHADEDAAADNSCFTTERQLSSIIPLWDNHHSVGLTACVTSQSNLLMDFQINN